MDFGNFCPDSSLISVRWTVLYDLLRLLFLTREGFPFQLAENHLGKILLVFPSLATTKRHPASIVQAKITDAVLFRDSLYVARNVFCFQFILLPAPASRTAPRIGYTPPADIDLS